MENRYGTIESWLEDEESKFIYRKRVEYNNTGNYDCFKDIISRYIPELKEFYYYPEKTEELRSIVRNKKKVLIWGAGIRGRRVAKLISTAVEVQCFVDCDINKKDTYVDGIKVYYFDDVDWLSYDCIIISIGINYVVGIECEKKLVDLGVNSENIILFSKYSSTALEDVQYFDEDIIKLNDGEVFIDAGALDLLTSVKFAEYCKKHCIDKFKIYAFEPDPKNFNLCVKNSQKYMQYNINVINMGLYSSNTKLLFDANGGSKISLSKDAVSVDVVSLDSWFNDVPTYIKMDIEGAEMEALKGCAELIRKYKPKLAISIYHKGEDIIDIPTYIKDLVPEYKLYIRHYGNNDCETILYAV